MNQKVKRIGSLVLAVCMIMTMLPLTVSAETGSMASGTMDIGGETGISLTSDNSGTGWAWDASTATLTLNSSYGGDYIEIDCDEDDIINLIYNRDVSLNVDDPYAPDAIHCEGNLIISVGDGGGTLTITHGGQDFTNALYTGGTLTFHSGTVKVNESGINNAVHASGDVTIEAEASVDITNRNNYGLSSSGSLYLYGSLTAAGGSTYDAVDLSSVYVNGGKLTTTGAAIGYSGNVNADVVVSSGEVNICGDLESGLTVIDGTVNISGIVLSSINVIGGNVTVDGQQVNDFLSNPTLILDTSEEGANPFRLAALTGPAADDVSGYTWKETEKKLILTGFDYTSDAATALKIVNGAVEIVLASDSQNALASCYSGNGPSYGIDSENDITFSGSGSLTTTGGTSTDSYSSGIFSYSGDVIINSGNITAIGGSADNSSGICADGMTINGGSVTATASTGTSASYGAYMPYGKITHAGGTLILSGNDKAFLLEYNSNMELTAPAYTWWANTDSNVDPGGAGINKTVLPFTDGKISAYKFVKLSEFGAYSINVNNGTANKSTAAPGETVMLTADPAPAGQQFKKWTVQSGGVTLIDAQDSSTDFIMPKGRVEVTATYEVIPYLKVLDVSVNDSNKDNITGQGISGRVSYNPATKTLTLNKAVITPTSSLIDAIYTEDDLIVELVGQNRIGTWPSNPETSEGYNVQIGILSGKSLSLTGKGSLTIYDSVTGILGADNLTVDIGGSLIVVEYGNEGAACCLKTNGVLTIERGNLNLTSYNSKGLQGDSIVINDGIITVQTQGASGHFAFNKEPSFNGSYGHTVFAGDKTSTATEVTSPVEATFTASKYVRVQPESAEIYTVSFDINGGNTLFPGTLNTDADGKLSVLLTPTRSGSYRFNGWFTEVSGGTPVTTNTVFTADTTIYAHWTFTGGGSSSSSGGSMTPPTTPTTPVPQSTPEKKPAPPVVAPDAPGKMNDTASHWGKDAIDYVISRGLFAGTSNSTFSPDNQMTRAMVWTVLARLDGHTADSGSSWYSAAQIWARDNGISDGSLPEADVTREQLISILYRYTGSPASDHDINDFADAGQVSDWATPAMQWAVENGLILGSDKSLNPQGNATRAEVAAILMRYIQLTRV